MGCSGAGALYFGKQTFLDLSHVSLNGLECTDVNLVTIRKQNRVWIRKYIKTDPTDGLTRLKTALRVAKNIYDTQKPDLVQVVVLDKNGPTLRADIRGRALGADVVYVPHPADVGEDVSEPPLTARYYDGAAGATGLFYGARVDVPVADAETMFASIEDKSDCVDPVAATEPKKEKGQSKTAEAELDLGAPSREYTASIAAEPDLHAWRELDAAGDRGESGSADAAPFVLQPLPPPLVNAGAVMVMGPR